MAFFNSLSAAITAVANALAAREHNVSLRMLTEIGNSLYEAKKEILNLHDGAANERDIDLAELRLQALEEQERRILSAAARTASVDAPGVVPPKAIPVSDQ